MDFFLLFPSVFRDMTLGWPLAVVVWVEDYRKEMTLAQPCLRERSKMEGSERTLGTFPTAHTPRSALSSVSGFCFCWPNIGHDLAHVSLREILLFGVA